MVIFPLQNSLKRHCEELRSKAACKPHNSKHKMSGCTHSTHSIFVAEAAPTAKPYRPVCEGQRMERGAPCCAECGLSGEHRSVLASLWQTVT